MTDWNVHTTVCYIIGAYKQSKWMRLINEYPINNKINCAFMYQMKQGGDGKRYGLKKFLYTEISNK